MNRTLFIFSVLFALTSCQNQGTANETAFDNVVKLTLDKIHSGGEKELILEISDENEIQKIIGFVEDEDADNLNCSFQLKITFQKYNEDNIEAFLNVNEQCNNISYTFKSNFYSKRISAEGANYLKLMTGL